MLDDGRDALNELSVEKCHARKSSKAGGTHHLIELFWRDFVVELIKVLLSKHTIPHTLLSSKQLQKPEGDTLLGRTCKELNLDTPIPRSQL